jgi:glycosyltransferase involved in cell wall biosynthesis
MRVLWTVNIVLPEAAERLSLPRAPFGGWLSAMTSRLARVPEVEIGIAMRAPVDRLVIFDIGGIRYYAMPQSRTDIFDLSQEDCEAVLQDFQPDLLHAEGSEMAYTRRYLRTWRGPRLLSLQGVINGYEPYELGRLRIGRMLLSPRQIPMALALLANKWLRFRPRLRKERETIRLADHVMGRTLWDQAQAWAINPAADYHACSRILREDFYHRRWSPADCERYSLFVGNAASPRKGAHIAVRALALLRRSFPGIRLYIAGHGAEPGEGVLRRWCGYPAYLRQLIRELGVQDAVVFTGVLDGAAMADRLCRSHVYLMSSLIENSPNTLGEAMIMGVPSVVAYSGGAPDMAADGTEALFYRADDPAMLALQVRRLLEDDALAGRISGAAVARARRTHDPEANVQALLDAYRHVLDIGGGESA